MQATGIATGSRAVANAAPRPRAAIRCEATADRRAVMLAGLALLPLVAQTPAAQAKYTSQLCVLQDSGEAADECRRNVIAGDAPGADTYSSAAKREGNAMQMVEGVPVAKLDTVYVAASNKLIALLEDYCALEDIKQRIAVSKALKAEGVTWVSKYARGGSARSESARKLYIAVDGVFGFLASNGMAPYPKAKQKATLALIEQVKVFLAEGK